MTAQANRLWIVTLVVLMTVVSSAGCQRHGGDKASLPGRQTVLARVNGEAITEFDRQRMIDDMLGPDQGTQLDAAARRKVLESLVASRAMAQAVIKELDTEEQLNLDNRVAAYREQLLVKSYLKRHAAPVPVTDAMVRDYYAQHPERFGGVTIRNYEMIACSRLSGPARENLLKSLQGAAGQKDWQAYVAALDKHAKVVEYRQGRLEPGLLEPRLLQATRGLKVGATSELTFVDDVPYLVRIVSEQQRPPRPLAEVSAEIRKALVPVQLKQAIRTASAQVLKNAKVEYMNTTTEK